MPDIPQNIPPQVMAALQQQQGGMSGGDITSILAQLAQMSPDELSAALQQLGVNISPDQLVGAAENWLEGAADKQANGGAEATGDEADTEADPYGSDRTRGVNPEDEEAAEGETGEEPRQPTPAEESAEGEGEDVAEGEGEALPPNAQYTDYSPAQHAAMPPQMHAQLQARQQQGAAMPQSTRGMPPAAAMRGAAAGGGSTMDDLVSAAIMQQAAGNPNAAVPMPRGARPRMPMAPTSQGNIRTRNPLSARSRKRG